MRRLKREAKRPDWKRRLKRKTRRAFKLEMISRTGNKRTRSNVFCQDLEKIFDDLPSCSLIETAPRLTVHTLDTVESCTHEVAVPPGQDYVPLRQPERDPAKTYPFTLDPFQKQAILCIENNQSVLVSAHTSAGKTV